MQKSECKQDFTHSFMHACGLLKYSKRVANWPAAESSRKQTSENRVCEKGQVRDCGRISSPLLILAHVRALIEMKEIWLHRTSRPSFSVNVFSPLRVHICYSRNTRISTKKSGNHARFLRRVHGWAMNQKMDLTMCIMNAKAMLRPWFVIEKMLWLIR